MTIELVTEAHLPELLPLMRGYCDFYEVEPSDAALLDMSKALLAEAGRRRAHSPSRGPTTIAGRDLLRRPRRCSSSAGGETPPALDPSVKPPVRL